MSGFNYTREEWEDAQTWAQRIIRASDGIAGYRRDNAALVLSAYAAMNLPKPPASDATKDDALGKVTRVTVISENGVEFERYGIFSEGCSLAVQDAGRTLKVFPKNFPLVMVPTLNDSHVQQEPPEDMQGWWATHTEYGRVLIAYPKRDVHGEVVSYRAGDEMGLFVCADNLTDWSRERDIEGADHA